jgi:Sec7-like guanine-nucleotide exchange factor
MRVSDEFMSLFNFSGARVDASLRTFLAHVKLDGGAGERAQLLRHFSQRYHECNPTQFPIGGTGNVFFFIFIASF